MTTRVGAHDTRETLYKAAVAYELTSSKLELRHRCSRSVLSTAMKLSQLTRDRGAAATARDTAAAWLTYSWATALLPDDRVGAGRWWALLCAPTIEMDLDDGEPNFACADSECTNTPIRCGETKRICFRTGKSRACYDPQWSCRAAHADRRTSLFSPQERAPPLVLPYVLTRRGLGVRVLDFAQIDRGCFFYYKKRLCKAFLTNGLSVKCYSYMKLEIFATFNY